MTTNSAISDLERAALEVAKERTWYGSTVEVNDRDRDIAARVLKAHAEHLEEKGLVVVPDYTKDILKPTDPCYETWFHDLKKVASKDDLDAVDWAGYWMDAYSPADAWAEDQSYD